MDAIGVLLLQPMLLQDRASLLLVAPKAFWSEWKVVASSIPHTTSVHVFLPSGALT